MARFSKIDLEPKLGRYVSELVSTHHHLSQHFLDDGAELDRLPFIIPDPPQSGVGPHGQHMVDLAFRMYRYPPLVAYEFADVHLLGEDGIVVLESGVAKDSLSHLASWRPESNISEARGDEYVRLRAPVPLTNFYDDGRYAIGFNGAWRNHGHWLLQCLPRLHAFSLLRRKMSDLKLVLPAHAEGSAVARTLELLGIEPTSVITIATKEAAWFHRAIVMPNFDIWSITKFAIAAADALIAGLPSAYKGSGTRSSRIYLHRKVATRNVVNFDILHQLLSAYAFKVISFEDIDFVEQIATMLSAQQVISEHGAATTNILFCHSSTRVLQLFNPYCVEPTFWTVASRRRIEYGYMIGTHSNEQKDPKPSWNSNYVVSPDRLEETIRRMLWESTSGMPLPPIGYILRSRGFSTRPSPLSVTSTAPSDLTTTTDLETEDNEPTPDRIIDGGTNVSLGESVSTRGFAGIADPVFTSTSDVWRFGRTRGNERLVLAPPAMPPEQRPMHDERMMPPEFVKEHYAYHTPGSVTAYALSGAKIWSSGLVTLGSRYVAIPDCVPGYFRETFREGAAPLPDMFAGAIGRSDFKTIKLDRPVAVATHPNLSYGRFLLEVLPRLWLLAVMREFGADIPLALSHTVAEPLKWFARQFHTEENTIWYDGATERVDAPSVILPSMLHTEYNFHPALNLMVRDLLSRLPPGGTHVPKLIYISRANFGDERLENPGEIEQAMERLGFSVVQLGNMKPEEQLKLFASARVVVAEHGEALLGALFCSPGTRIVAINFGNHYQSAIARLRRHHIAYVRPADGNFRHWRLGPGFSPKWRVEIEALSRTVRGVMRSMR